MAEVNKWDGSEDTHTDPEESKVLYSALDSFE